MRPLLSWCFALIGCAAALHAEPTFLVLTLPPAGGPGSAELPGRLADWRKSGLVSDVYQISANDPRKTGFASLAVLEFPDEACRAQWQSQGAPAAGSAVTVTPVERMLHGETFPRDSTKAIFEIAQYDVKVPNDRYRDYAAGYVAPEMELMRQQKVITSYFLFTAQDRDHAAFHSILLMEFRDSVALERRTQVMADARKQLTSDAAWKHWSDIKSTIREEKILSEGAWQLLPAPALADLPSYRPEYHVTGTVRVLGSFLKFAVANLEEGFLKYQTEAQFASNFTTSSEGAMGGLCTGVSDLAPMGDDAKIQDLMPFYNVYGYTPTEISVATGDYEKRGCLWPAVIVVNKDNPLAHLSMRQLDGIFGSERTGGWSVGDNPQHNILFTAALARGADQNLRTWDQLGLGGEFAGHPIQTYGYIAPGFAVYFQRKVLHWSQKYNPNFREFVEPKEAVEGPDGKAVSSDRMLDELSQDKYGIGWVANFHAKFYPKLKAIALAPGDTQNYVPYTPETVANRSYPLARDAYFYVNKEPGRPLDPKVREFMRFVLSREGQQIIAHTGFFYPLNAQELAAQRKKLDE